MIIRLFLNEMPRQVRSGLYCDKESFQRGALSHYSPVDHSSSSLSLPPLLFTHPSSELHTAPLWLCVGWMDAALLTEVIDYCTEVIWGSKYGDSRRFWPPELLRACNEDWSHSVVQVIVCSPECGWASAPTLYFRGVFGGSAIVSRFEMCQEFNGHGHN